MITLEQILLMVFGGAGLQLGLAYLAKSLISQWLTKDIESYKAKVKAAGDLTVEQTKAALAMTALEHQVRYSKLHERRAEGLAELYRLLVEAHNKAHQYAVQLAGAHGQNEPYLDVERSILALYTFFEINRIYLPEEICDLLQDFHQTLRKSVAEVWAYSGIGFPSHGNRVKAGEVILKAFESFSDGDIQQARHAIEREFRAILNPHSIG